MTGILIAMVPLSIALIQRFFGVHERLGAWRIAGLGLGLAVCRTIISAQGGQLWATHNPARGASFHFKLSANFARPA